MGGGGGLGGRDKGGGMGAEALTRSWALNNIL